MDRAKFVRLAEGYIRQEEYEDKVKETIKSLATEYGQYEGFLGLSIGADPIMNPALEVLGDDFAFYHYDCQNDFDKFNRETFLDDDSHPNVHTLGELYDYSNQSKEGAKEKEQIAKGGKNG